jgi:acetylornithine/succinyldiaminopimelate/putrescine aminotransferase
LLPELITDVPGPESRRLAGELRRHESHNVTYVSPGWPVFWERADGANVWDVDGNRFLDLTGAFAVAGLGHGRREIVEAMCGQAGVLLHGMGDVHPTRLKTDLCRELSRITFERWGEGTAKTILSNSGFEAVETALKTALLATGRAGVLAFEGGYHGLGYGALMGTGIRKFRDPFRAQLVNDTRWLRFPRDAGELEELERELGKLPGDDVGMVLVEPIQGRGGVVIPPAGFLALLRRWCDAHGALLVCDEIYTGFHRTGRLFACDWEGVVPDLICLGKALSGGFPISACVGPARVMDRWPVSGGEALHTSTFLGHPVGCAMALEALRLHQNPETEAMVSRVGSAMESMLHGLGLPEIREVRGRGAMWAAEFEDPTLPGRLAEELLNHGLFLLPSGTRGEVLSFSPPFVISNEEVQFCGERLKRILPGR